MALKIHFETLSPGLKAKLDAKYRVSGNHRSNGTHRKLYRNGNGATLLEDDVKMAHNRI